MNNWERKTLSDCCISIADGDHQPPPKDKTGVPFVTISNIDATNHFDFSNTMFVPPEYYENLDEKRKARKNDILYSVVGSFGIPVFIKEDKPFVFQRHIAILRPNERIVPRFLYYSMLSKDFYAKADAAAVGAAQRTVSLSALRNIKIDVPSLETQEKISSFLSAYDDLIENNQKQIKLLEEAVRRLYKEWFVDFRFPGHESVSIIDGVPQGWRKIPVGELIGYEIGGGWGEEAPTKDCDKEGFVIRGTDLYGLTHGVIQSVPFRYHAAHNLSARTLADGDIIFEVSGGSKTEGVARTAFINDALLKRWNRPVMCASFCKLVRVSDKRYAQFLYDCLQYLRKCGKTSEYDKKSASSIVNYRWKDFLSQERILIPDETTVLAYNQFAGAIYQKIVNCSVQIELCTKARDRLLPELMNGRYVDV